MKKTLLLYILLHFSLTVLADWITVEHDFNMCKQIVPSNRAALHIDDDGVTYSTSLLVRNVETVKHNPPLTTINVTMWGCTYDCHFSFMLNINRDDFSVLSYTDENHDNNYKCNLSNYTMKLLPTPKITYKQKAPNPDHVFPTHLTAHYCSIGKHPDAPNWPINKTENVAECIDYLTGNEVGTYAATLRFGTGSSFKPDDYGVATYHLINSANKLFNHWESHHRGFHDALSELSIKMTTNNLVELRPPPPPPRKKNMLKEIILVVAGIASLAVGFALAGLPAEIAVAEGAEASFVEVSEVGAEIGAADDVIATTAEGTEARNAAVALRNVAIKSPVAERENELTSSYYRYLKFKSYKTYRCMPFACPRNAIEKISSFYQHSENPNVGRILATLNRLNRRRKRDTEDNIGFFTVNMVNVYFLPSLMDNVHQSFTGNDQDYPDISSYLSAASEHLQFHFEDTLHNNFFTANKSILASFTINQGVNYDQILDNDDDIYTSVKQSTYNNMAASIISNILQMYKVEICDPKPSFCGQPCGDSGHIYCPTIGNDNCVIAAADSQIKELKFLRDTFDICSTDDDSTGWNINHNANCDIKQFQCK